MCSFRGHVTVNETIQTVFFSSIVGTMRKHANSSWTWCLTGVWGRGSNKMSHWLNATVCQYVFYVSRRYFHWHGINKSEMSTAYKLKKMHLHLNHYILISLTEFCVLPTMSFKKTVPYCFLWLHIFILMPFLFNQSGHKINNSRTHVFIVSGTAM